MNEYELCSDIMTTEELDKFDLRLWNRKKKEFYSLEDLVLRYFDLTDEDGCPLYACIDEDQHLKPQYRNWTIELYIEMKDKNGKKIYENDIIKHSMLKDAAVIKYSEEYALYFADAKRTKVSLANLADKPNSIEVIGNIHENPELLGDKNNELLTR